MEPWFLGILAGIIGGGATFLVLALTLPERKCPNCGRRLPKLQPPANRRQALWGNRTCLRCGCEVDRQGRRVSG
jgi:hypothetical protein